MRQPSMSGWCGAPSPGSHERCHVIYGGGNRANPRKEFSPCPCTCHFGDETFECGGCGGVLKEAPHWPQEDPDYEGEPVYTHIDPRTGRATGEECPA
jgi:predicted Fe-S protein YdhL (DUF1289 family)